MWCGISKEISKYDNDFAGKLNDSLKHLYY